MDARQGGSVGFADRLRAMLDWSGFPGRVGFAAWDLAEREPVTWHADRPVHSASTIKVLILVAALRQVHNGSLTLDGELVLPDPGSRAGGSGVLWELPGVQHMTLRDLLTLMIVISDNAATNVVIDAIGFPAINECGRDLGCTATSIERHLMDSGGKTTTALDQALVLDRLASGTAVPPELTRLALELLSRQQVRDRLPALLAAGATSWNKPGELLGLRHDVGLIGTGRQPRAVVAVLVDQLVDERSRRGTHGGPACERIAEIGRWVYQALEPG
jgi:beta-lactamase class A